MPYSCDDIKIILNFDDEESIDKESFSQHIANCRRCNDLCSPEPEIETMLSAAFAPAAPAGFADEIMGRLSAIESRRGLVSWLEDRLSYIFAGMLLAICAVIVMGWSYFIGAFSGIDIQSMVSGVAEIASRARLQEISLSDFETYIQKTPIILFTLTSAVMVVWIFSIFEIEKSLK
jgi:hypothetical protein